MGVVVGEKEAIMENVKAINKLSDEKKSKIVMMSIPTDTDDYYEIRRKSAKNRHNDDLGTAFLVENSLASSSYDSSSSSCGGD